MRTGGPFEEEMRDERLIHWRGGTGVEERARTGRCRKRKERKKRKIKGKGGGIASDLRG